MNTISIIIIVAAVFVLFTLVFIVINIYNGLIQSRENINKSWANIDVILKQRYDEIPQIIHLCEQYVSFEKKMIDEIMSAREKMINGKDPEKKAQGFNEVTKGLKGVLAIGEAYPDLKSSEHFLQIQNRLSELEKSISERREFYNDSVNIYNIRIQEIPDLFIARLLNFKRKKLFEIKEEVRNLPNTSLKL